MKYMLKLFKQIDVFGNRIELTFLKKKEHKTYFGALLTVIVFITCALGSRSITSDFLIKKDPTILFKEILITAETEVNQQLQDLNMIFSLQDTVSNQLVNLKDVVNNLSFQLRFILLPLDVESQILKGQQTSIPCSSGCDSSNGIELKSIYVDEYHLAIKGGQSLKNMRSIMFEVTPIRQDLNNYQVKIQFRQYSFQSDLYYFPFEWSDKIIQFPLVEKGRETIFQLTTVSTDKGLILPQFEEQKQLIFKSIALPLEFISPGKSVFLFKLNEFNMQYGRKYLKLQSVLALIGGLLKSLLVLGKLLSKPIQKLSMMSSLIEQLFNFTEIPTQTTQKFLRKSKLKDDQLELQLQLENQNNNSGFFRLPSNTREEYFDKNDNKQKGNINTSRINIEGDFKTDIIHLNPPPLLKQIQSHIQMMIKSKLKYQRNLTQRNLTENQPTQQKAHKYDKQICKNIEENKITTLSQNEQNETRSLNNLSYQNGQHNSAQKDNERSFNKNPIEQIVFINNDSKQKYCSNNKQKKSIFKKQNSNILQLPSLEKSPKKESNTLILHQTKCQVSPGKVMKFEEEQRQTVINNDQCIDSEVNVNKSMELEYLRKASKCIDSEVIFNKDFESHMKVKKEIELCFQPIVISDINEIKIPKQKCIKINQLNNLIENTYAKDDFNINKSSKTLNNNEQNNLFQEEKMKRSISVGDFSEKNELPLLKKQDTQFVADLIQMRLKERADIENSNQLSKKNLTQKNLTIKIDDTNNTHRKRQTKKQKTIKLQSKKRIVEIEESTKNGQDLSNSKQNTSKKPSSPKQVEGQDLETSLDQLSMKKEIKKDNEFKQQQEFGRQSIHENEEVREKFDRALENRQAKTLKLGVLDYLKYFLYQRDTKKEQINYCAKKVKQRLDIVYILNKLVEIDKLKMLLLDHDQRELFEFLPRPVVLHTNHANTRELNDKYNMQEAWNLLQEEKASIDKATDACLAYKIISQKVDKNVLENRLLQMLDIKIKHVFDSTDIPQQLVDERIHLSQADINLHSKQDHVFHSQQNQSKTLFINQEQSEKTNLSSSKLPLKMNHFSDTQNAKLQIQLVPNKKQGLSSPQIDQPKYKKNDQLPQINNDKTPKQIFQFNFIEEMKNYSEYKAEDNDHEKDFDENIKSNTQNRNKSYNRNNLQSNSVNILQQMYNSGQKSSFQKRSGSEDASFVPTQIIFKDQNKCILPEIPYTKTKEIDRVDSVNLYQEDYEPSENIQESCSSFQKQYFRQQL